MKHLRILYFSATGNTKRVVGIMRESCAAVGIESEALEIKKTAIARLAAASPYTETLIAFPALGFGAPSMVLKRARSLPRGNGTAARVLAVCGAEMRDGRAVRGFPGSGPRQLEAILKRKGYDVASTGFVSYPSNWIQLSAPPSGEARESLLAVGDGEARKYAASAIAGERGLYRCGAGNRLWTSVVNFLFRTIGRRVLGKFFAADASCTGCEACAKSCPVRAITMKGGRPYWKLSCEDCNRCINICPAKAIQVSVAKIALYVLVSLGGYVLAARAGSLALAAFLPGIGGAAYSMAMAAIILVSTVPIIAIIAGPIDALVGLATRAAPIARLLGRSYTSRFGRYKEPGFRP